MTRLSFLFFFVTGSALAQDLPPGEGDPHAGVEGAPHRERSLATAEASAAVPAGTIRVTVVDRAGQPVPNAEVNVGVMAAEGRRDRIVRRTDATGVAFFPSLETGTSQAYRVNAPHEGATTSSNPFQLPPNVGYDVHIRRLAVTRDARVLLQLVDTMIELRESRAHVTQRLQLINLGQETYVFPVRGQRYELPHGFLAFQSEPVMTDQHVSEAPGGVQIVGSLPPGGVVLAWAFDVPLSGASLTLVFPVHVRTYQMRVTCDAPEGLRMNVDAIAPGTNSETLGPASQFSRPIAAEMEGRGVLLSDLERVPADPPLQRIEVRLTGIPTPGPLRWIAVVLALLLVGGGLVLAVSGRAATVDRLAARKARREALLAEAQALAADRARGDAGPKFVARRRAELVSELALLLHAERETKGVRKSAGRASKRA